MIINRYREATAALGYTGDSVLNSLSDIAMMGVGFLLARRLPFWASIAVVLVLELVPLLVIRDNLTLNVWMLLAPNDASGVADGRLGLLASIRPMQPRKSSGFEEIRFVRLSVLALPALPLALARRAPAQADEIFGGLYVHDVDTPLTISRGRGRHGRQLGWRGEPDRRSCVCSLSSSSR